MRDRCLLDFRDSACNCFVGWSIELFVVRECVQQFTVTLEDMTVLATNAGLSASDHLLLGFGLSASLAPAEHKGLRTQCTTSD